MATFQRTPNARWQAQVRRFGKKAFKVFDTRADAEAWAEDIEEEWRQEYETTTHLFSRYGAVAAAWEYARRVIRGGRKEEPQDEEIAAFLLDHSPMRQVLQLDLLADQTAAGVLAHKAYLEQQMDRAVEAAAADRAIEDDD
jgi:hypothetical protein